jgi:site-specific DNA-methyltransferase (adenine-specific)
MEDNFIDLTVTSPPYDNLREYKGYSFKFEDIAKELYRVTKEGGVVVWVVGDATINGSESLTSFKQAIYFVEQCGFNLHDTMIYWKNSAPINYMRYEPAFEFMFVISKGKPKTFNAIFEKKTWKDKRLVKATKRNKDGSFVLGFASQKEIKIADNIWYYNVGGGHVTKDKEAYKHPAIFPEKLAEDHIISWSNEGDLVYDCFGGSGTVAKMACKWQRNWILSEISEEYCKIAEKRISNYLSQGKLEL